MSWPHLRLSTLKNICLLCQTWLSKVWDGLSTRKYIRVSIIKFTLWKSTCTLFIPYFKLIFILPFRVQLLAASSFKKSNLHLNRNCFNHLASQKSKHFIHSSFFFLSCLSLLKKDSSTVLSHDCYGFWAPSMGYSALPPTLESPSLCSWTVHPAQVRTGCEPGWRASQLTSHGNSGFSSIWSERENSILAQL